MIPDMQAIQANLALGFITERQAEELYFLIELVDRDYRQSGSEPQGANPEMTQSNTEKCKYGNCR